MKSEKRKVTFVITSALICGCKLLLVMQNESHNFSPNNWIFDELLINNNLRKNVCNVSKRFAEYKSRELRRTRSKNWKRIAGKIVFYCVYYSHFALYSICLVNYSLISSHQIIFELHSNTCAIVLRQILTDSTLQMLCSKWKCKWNQSVCCVD